MFKGMVLKKGKSFELGVLSWEFGVLSLEFGVNSEKWNIENISA